MTKKKKSQLEKDVDRTIVVLSLWIIVYSIACLLANVVGIVILISFTAICFMYAKYVAEKEKKEKLQELIKKWHKKQMKELEEK